MRVYCPILATTAIINTIILTFYENWIYNTRNNIFSIDIFQKGVISTDSVSNQRYYQYKMIQISEMGPFTAIYR